MPSMMNVYSPVLPSAALGNAITTAKVFRDSAAAALLLRAPGSNKLKNRAFRIRAWGRVTGGTTTNFTVDLQLGSSTTAASNTTLASSGAIAVNSVSLNWLLDATFVHDVTSAKIAGIFFGFINATAKTPAIATSAAFDASLESNSFVLNGLFSATAATNEAFIDGFELEVL